MSSSFTDLEKAVFESFVQTYKDENLRSQLEGALLENRDYTGHGFFVTLKIPRSLPAIEIEKLKVGPAHEGWPIHGPNIKAEGIDMGGGSMLFGEEGYVTQLELYAFGNDFKENVEEFHLVGSDEDPTLGIE